MNTNVLIYYIEISMNYLCLTSGNDVSQATWKKKSTIETRRHLKATLLQKLSKQAVRIPGHKQHTLRRYPFVAKPFAGNQDDEFSGPTLERFLLSNKFPVSKNSRRIKCGGRAISRRHSEHHTKLCVSDFAPRLSFTAPRNSCDVGLRVEQPASK